MKALSLWQPWATLFISGWKQVETRGWSTPERGLIAIHSTASLPPLGRKKLEDDDFQDALFHCVPAGGGYGLRSKVLPHQLPYGAILGVADLTDCVQMTQERINYRAEFDSLEHAFGDYQPGRYEWHFRKVTRFVEPIPCKGLQKLWNVRGEAAEQLEDRLRKAGMDAPTAAQLSLAGAPSTSNREDRG